MRQGRTMPGTAAAGVGVTSWKEPTNKEGRNVGGEILRNSCDHPEEAVH